MNRGALIGGAVLLAVLVGFGGLYIAMASGTPVVEGRASESKGISISLPGGEKLVVKGDPGLVNVPQGDVPDASGRTKKVEVTTRPRSEGLGADRWEALRLKQANETQAKAMGVVSEFVKGKTDEDADTVREVFFYLFDTSTAIREDIKLGAITQQEARIEMSELRGNTIRELTEVLGAKDYSVLQRELRTADAAVF